MICHVKTPPVPLRLQFVAFIFEFLRTIGIFQNNVPHLSIFHEILFVLTTSITALQTMHSIMLVSCSNHVHNTPCHVQSYTTDNPDVQ